MADKYYLYVLCPVCDGDGVVTTPSPIPPHELEDKICPECLGENAKHPVAGGLYRGWMVEVE